MKKRILSLILALSMVLSVLPLGAFAEGFTQDLVMQNGYPVGSIGDGWWYRNDTLYLNDGEYDFRYTNPKTMTGRHTKQAVLCAIVISSGVKITGGTFNATVYNGQWNGPGGTISGGTFAGSVENQGNVTGGVVSGLGKGITAASLGRLLKCRGLKVASQKLDPYVNVDPGTMSPLQHGEVFVTDDGTETDLDLGHYERFIDENLNKYSNLTTGKVYWNVLNKERQGAYLGQTVQIIPHITNEIKSYIYNLASSTEADVVITEIGGTTGDIESQPHVPPRR